MDGMSILPGQAILEVAFLFDEIILYKQGSVAGFKKNPTHLLPWPELR
jgi:hypothetical protein